MDTNIVSLPHYQEKLPVRVRPMTLAEGLAIPWGCSLEFVSNSGDVRNCRPNGKVRTWKRDLTRVEIPTKYGMYEYRTFTWDVRSQRFIAGNANVYLVKRA